MKKIDKSGKINIINIIIGFLILLIILILLNENLLEKKFIDNNLKGKIASQNLYKIRELASLSYQFIVF